MKLTRVQSYDLNELWYDKIILLSNLILKFIIEKSSNIIITRDWNKNEKTGMIDLNAIISIEIMLLYPHDISQSFKRIICNKAKYLRSAE